MNVSLRQGIARAVSAVALIGVTIGIGVMVIAAGRVPSFFSTVFFVPIIFAAYRHSLSLALALAFIASFFGSPAMALFGVNVDDTILPVLWLGWPAVYLFLAVSLNQWSSMQEQRSQLDVTELHLVDARARNEKREQELETLSAIHSTILSGSD